MKIGGCREGPKHRRGNGMLENNAAQNGAERRRLETGDSPQLAPTVRPRRVFPAHRGVLPALRP